MAIVGGFDVHRKQITFDYVDNDGLVQWGQIRPATRKTLRSWLAKHCPEGAGEFALEGCTGWRYVSEELTAAGVGVHLGDPAEIAALRGPKKRAKSQCPAVAHVDGGGPVPRVVDPAGARGRDPGPGPVVLRVDGGAAGLAAAHPRPVIPSGLPTSEGVVVRTGPRGACGRGVVGGGAPVCGYRIAAH